jgi:tetrahydromethanopterin S-methyltransferase subunit G
MENHMDELRTEAEDDKKIEATTENTTEWHNDGGLYSKVDIPIKVLDGIIIGGILLMVLIVLTSI